MPSCIVPGKCLFLETGKQQIVCFTYDASQNAPCLFDGLQTCGIVPEPSLALRGPATAGPRHTENLSSETGVLRMTRSYNRWHNWLCFFCSVAHPCASFSCCSLARLRYECYFQTCFVIHIFVHLRLRVCHRTVHNVLAEHIAFGSPASLKQHGWWTRKGMGCGAWGYWLGSMHPSCYLNFLLHTTFNVQHICCCLRYLVRAYIGQT